MYRSSDIFAQTWQNDMIVIWTLQFENTSLEVTYHTLLVMMKSYRKTSNISRSFIDNKLVDNSDVVGASPVGAAPTTSSFST